MTDAQIAALAGCAVLVFWAVGAYNRLIALRDNIAKAFVPVDDQVQHRHELLMQWAHGLHAVLDQVPSLYEAVLMACAQLQSACDGLRARPSTGSAATSLHLAEQANSVEVACCIVERYWVDSLPEVELPLGSTFSLAVSCWRV